MFQQQKQTPRPQKKNICFGTAKVSGEENRENLLAADVDLVATGVGKDCTNEDLKEFLKDKGIDAVAVETLTKDEVLPNVRTKTFKVTVRPAQYENALNPEVWPYRVGVRHFRAPRRPDREGTWSNQSGRTGGLVDRGGQASAGAGGVQAGAQGRGGSGLVGHANHKQGKHQQRMEQPAFPDPLQVSNLFNILGQLGSLEMPTH